MNFEGLTVTGCALCCSINSLKCDYCGLECCRPCLHVFKLHHIKICDDEYLKHQARDLFLSGNLSLLAEEASDFWKFGVDKNSKWVWDTVEHLVLNASSDFGWNRITYANLSYYVLNAKKETRARKIFMEVTSIGMTLV